MILFAGGALTGCDPAAIVASLDQASVFSVLVDWRQSARKPDEIEPVWDRTVFTQETVMVVNDNPVLRAQGRPLEPENFRVTLLADSDDQVTRSVGWSSDIWLETGGVPFQGGSALSPGRMGFSLLSPLTTTRPVIENQDVNVQVEGLLLNPGQEATVTLRQQAYNGSILQPQSLSQVKVRLDPDVLLIPMKVTVIRYLPEVSPENPLGWRHGYPNLSEKIIRNWIDGYSVDYNRGASIVRDGTTGLRSRPALMSELYPVRNWNGSDDPFEGKTSALTRLNLDTVFAACKIQFRLMEVSFASVQSPCRALRTAGGGQPGCLTTRGANGANSLSEDFAHPGWVNVFLTDALEDERGAQFAYRDGPSGANGLQVSGDQGPVAVVAYGSILEGGERAHLDNVLAHEVGHMFETGERVFLDGRNAAPNLMSDNAPILNAEQCASARHAVMDLHRFDTIE